MYSINSCRFHRWFCFQYRNNLCHTHIYRDKSFYKKLWLCSRLSITQRKALSMYHMNSGSLYRDIRTLRYRCELRDHKGMYHLWLHSPAERMFGLEIDNRRIDTDWLHFQSRLSTSNYRMNSISIQYRISYQYNHTD
jgi:hypothetical protein